MFIRPNRKVIRGNQKDKSSVNLKIICPESGKELCERY